MISKFRSLFATTLATVLVASALAMPATAFAGKAYLEITLKVDPQDRPAAAAVYKKFKRPFLTKIPGAKSKELLIRDDDVQVLHGFATKAQAEAYLKSDLFTKDVVVALKPLLKADPEVRIYSTP
jgi:ABC-type sugar transport system substrate-binding protein